MYTCFTVYSELFCCTQLLHCDFKVVKFAYKAFKRNDRCVVRNKKVYKV